MSKKGDIFYLQKIKITFDGTDLDALQDEILTEYDVTLLYYR